MNTLETLNTVRKLVHDVESDLADAKSMIDDLRHQEEEMVDKHKPDGLTFIKAIDGRRNSNFGMRREGCEWSLHYHYGQIEMYSNGEWHQHYTVNSKDMNATDWHIV